MEIIQTIPTTNIKHSSRYRPTSRCGTVRVQQCGKGQYIQPPRVTSFAPKKIYCPPSKPLDGKSTYHDAYLNVDKTLHTRPKSFKPLVNLKTIREKFEDGTTSKTSYQPVWNIVKANPIVPRQKNLFAFKGPMESSTTVRHDFGPKNVEKPALIIPCGNIRSCTGSLDGRTTAGICYADPGRVIRPASFKPSVKYFPPQELIQNETTQKLSYQPYCVEQRKKYPWASKPSYVTPTTAMVSSTTYSNSFFLDGQQPEKEKPIIPSTNKELFTVTEPMIGTSLYHDCFKPKASFPIAPVVPCQNISISNQKMICETTNKLSYLPVKAEVRSPIHPKQTSLLNKSLIHELATTNQCDFTPKIVSRPDLIIPCNNIRNSISPLEISTTSGSSFKNPGYQQPPQSYKPRNNYQKSTVNIEGTTVNKSSYIPWKPTPKEEYPWAKKPQYKAPEERMVDYSSYNLSYAPPGYYVEECEKISN